MLEELEKPENQHVLAKTYWLCIFGVNEHRSICGTCWPRCPAPAQKGSGRPKFNLCSCGTPKYEKGDPEYEIDKFDDVVKLMDGGLVVSLDPNLETLKRVWVVAEIGEAMKTKPVQFGLFDNLAPGPMENLRSGNPSRAVHCSSCESDSK